MGGQRAWHLGAMHPERFAAVMPICGRIPEVEGFPERVCALEDCGGKVQLTGFPDGDHFCWGRVYEDQAVWDWLLSQRK